MPCLLLADSSVYEEQWTGETAILSVLQPVVTTNNCTEGIVL